MDARFVMSKHISSDISILLIPIDFNKLDSTLEKTFDGSRLIKEVCCSLILGELPKRGDRSYYLFS